MTMVSPARGGDAASAVPRSGWRAALHDTVVETFSIMAGTTITVSESSHLGASPQVTGVVGITGDFIAIFSLRRSMDFAVKVAAQMLGATIDERGWQETACDAVGEICNVIAGSFKARVGSGETCKLTLPMVVMGGEYRIHSLGSKERIELHLLYENAPMWAALEICM